MGASGLLWLVLLGCSGGEGGGDDTSGTGGDDQAAAWCDTAVEVGWEDFGHGFVLTHCQGCHASQAPDRYGAPESVVFDTEADCVERRADILRVVLEWESMPPAGGVTADEKALLETWLSCSY